MAKGHLSEDTINFIVTAESDQLQQEIHKSGKALGNLNAMTVSVTCHGSFNDYAKEAYNNDAQIQYN